MAQQQGRGPVFLEAASDATQHPLETGAREGKAGFGDTRPLGTCDVAPDEGLHKGVPGGVMWTNSRVQGESLGLGTERGFASDQKGASGLTHSQTSPQTQGGACPAVRTHRWVSLMVPGAPLGSRLSL